MKLATSLAVTAALAALGGSPAVEEIRFTPTEGLTLVRSFQTVSETDMEHVTEQGSSTSSSTHERTLVVTDEIGAAREGRILSLERTFDQIAAETASEMQRGDQSFEASTSGICAVEGAAVTFEWDADEEEYVASSDEVDQDVLDELVFDFDCTLLLPEDEVEEGDEWSLTPDDYRALMDPWDGLPWEYENAAGENLGADDGPEPEIEESDEGELVVTFAGTRDEDGVRVAVLTLAGEIETERTEDAEHEFAQGVSTEYSETTEARSIVGEALWNLDAGHLLSLELEVEVSAEGTLVSTAVFNDQELKMEVQTSRDGSIRFTAAFEAAE